MVFKKFCLGAACCAGAIAVGVVGLSQVVTAGGHQEHHGKIAPSLDVASMDMEKLGAAQMEAMTPGEHHHLMEHFIGKWDIEVKMWMAGDAQGEPQVSTGTSKIKSIMDGRFIEELMTTTLMGMPYKGRGTLGFDNHAGVYQSMWVDNFSTSMHFFEGSASHDGKSLIFYGTMGEPGLVSRRTVKSVTRMIDENTHVFEFHDLHIGETGTKVMQITYMRAG